MKMILGGQTCAVSQRKRGDLWIVCAGAKTMFFEDIYPKKLESSAGFAVFAKRAEEAFDRIIARPQQASEAVKDAAP